MHHPDMDQAALARAVAADLGGAVTAEVEREIKGEPPPGGGTRAFGISETMAAAGFLFSAAGVVTEVLRARKQSAELVADMANGLAIDPRLAAHLDPEKKLSLVAQLLNKVLPASIGVPGRMRGAATAEAMAEKQRWIADYMAERRRAAGIEQGGMATRDFVGGVTILQPFADQHWWIVWKDIGWLPDESDGPGVVRADVPRGFVTDLASVPSYLWSVLNKTGKHGNAAIYHDWLYWQQTCTRAEADLTFERAMADMGVDTVTRNLVWAGVRVFGGSYWDDNTQAKAGGEKRVLAKFPDDPTITWEDWKKRGDVFH